MVVFNFTVTLSSSLSYRKVNSPLLLPSAPERPVPANTSLTQLVALV